MFPLSQHLLNKARAILHKRESIYWIIGGACSGKSTICRAISERYGVAVYDMDEHIYGSYMSLYRPERHPASTAWFTAPNPLAWALSLSWEEWNALNRAADAEYLDLLADDLVAQEPQPLLVDGGITHPAVLVQAISLRNIVCIEAPDTDRVMAWETSADRAEMRGWIMALPDPGEMWKKFLDFDRLMTETIVAESRENGIAMFSRDGMTSAQGLAGTIAGYFGM